MNAPAQSWTYPRPSRPSRRSGPPGPAQLSRRAFGAGAAGVALAAALRGEIAGAQGQDDVVATLAAAGQLTTLARALQMAGLVETLAGPGPFTVFAPTEAAMAAVPAGRLNALLSSPLQLRPVLAYHVVPGRITAADLARLRTARTLQGENLRIAASGATVRVNGSAVVRPDVAASNGVIHVIDAVLLPVAGAVALPRTGTGPRPVR